MSNDKDNIDLVLKAFNTLFNERDFEAAERLWSPDYIQHSAHIAPGRQGLFDLVRSAPFEMRYENGLAMAQGDRVMLHGRFSNIGQAADWVVADIVRLENGRLAEHWDVVQDEATMAGSKSGHPMFGSSFPVRTVTDRHAATSGLGTPADVIAQLTVARNNGDVELAAACYESDPTIVAELGRIVSGREATYAFIDATAAVPLVITGRSIVQADGVALHQARWTVTQADGMTLSGCTADVLRQQADGSWRLALDNPWGSAIV